MPRLRRFKTSFCRPKRGRWKGRQSRAPIQPVEASIGGILEEIPSPSVNLYHAYDEQEDKLDDLDAYNSPSASQTSQYQPNMPLNLKTEDVSVSDILSDGLESYGDVPGTRPSGSNHMPSVSSYTASPIIPKQEVFDDNTSNLDFDSKETNVQDMEMFPHVQSFIKENIPEPWICLPYETGFTLLMIFRGEEPALQRHVFVGHNGTVKISVHRRALKPDFVEQILSEVPPLVSLTDATWWQYSERAISLVRRVNSFEICAGVDNKEYRHLWHLSGTGIVDNNPYGEQRYTETCRSKSCCFLVDSHKRRCSECNKLRELLYRKRRCHRGSDYNPNTANIHLDDAQKMAKLKDQHDEIRSQQIMIDKLRKINAVLEREGISVDDVVRAFIRETREATEETPF